MVVEEDDGYLEILFEVKVIGDTNRNCGPFEDEITISAFTKEYTAHHNVDFIGIR